MAKLKTIHSLPGNSSVRRRETIKASRKTTYPIIYPMMPRGYTAFERAALRKFERELLADRKVTVE